MLAKHAQALIAAMGKDQDAREGVITAPELAAAVASLQNHVQTLDAQPVPEEPETEEVEEQEPARESVPWAARALPLVQLMQASLAEQTFVTWSAQ